MKLYQPVLFVGLGGTGCLIGAELERRLREEFCGPDGTAIQRVREDALPYQLPDCVQFVYADVNQADLDRLQTSVVPGPQHVPAVQRTAHYVRGLVPRVDTYPEVARNLRLTAEREVAAWLPPEPGEPRVTPLQRGAGQLPTIGRAALFETFRGGAGAATAELNAAIGRLSGPQAATDLYKIGGRSSNKNAVDVFVAFSVAGGTGAGIFYDYLHLIGELFERTDLRPKIYPLVLMPSAFVDGLGGGRPAQLNAGRALLDLFRLVDQQNGGGARRELRGHTARTTVDPDEVAVHYPVDGRITLRPGTAQTGFLFCRPVGAEPGDLRRSVVSLMLSLLGTELDQRAAKDGEQHQSFADSFINASVERQIPAENGIGNRGVSTALVASLTVPVDELADLVAGRLLRAGVEDLRGPLPGVESNRTLMQEFFAVANISEIFTRPAQEHAEPEPVNGAKEVTAALNDRAEAMRVALSRLRTRLDREIPEKVGGFDPRDAVPRMLGKVDPFRLVRVLFGNPDSADEVERGGAMGLMQRRRVEPPAPEGLGANPPPLPTLRDRSLGMVKVKWTDPDPVEARERQDGWYRWRTNVQWTEPWSQLAPRWRKPLDQVEAALRGMTRALVEHAAQDRDRFRDRAADLSKARVGVSYLLPPGGDLERFYTRVVRRITDDLVGKGQLQPSATGADLLTVLIGADGWRDAYRTAWDGTPEAAVSELRERVKAEVKTYFRMAGQDRAPLLPTLHDLLAQAAGQTSAELSEAELEEFRGKLAGLVPANFSPQGSGRLKVLVSYPAGADDPAIESYLREAVNLPAGPDLVYDFTHTTAESIAVVLFRSSMGITDVREVRDVLRTWADAVERPQRQDYLKWRQRLGYDFGYLATHEEHRVQILHRLLCAMWNDKVTVDGDPASPISVSVGLSGGVSMTLELTPLEHASSWGSLLQAYELWTFADNAGIRRDFCAQLMQEAPYGVGSLPKQPGDLYLLLRDMAEGQIRRIDVMLSELHSSSRARAMQLRDFWARTYPAALDAEFTEVSAVRANLRALEKPAMQKPEEDR
ncbi:tubulin-like doman-containing protein [Actinomadura formosensis]|uniref:tubulin-like doman-containing protein n=1 Tax=Actinomadura formosensis TaxID=60706 RepID=UPI00082B9061|nr:tubulin-like doman-containing protein [Actinomadura formosensis]